MSFPCGSQQSDTDIIPTYTVCIIGDPRSGKSCFCNRFVYSHPDWYQENHPSVICEEDFYKSVVNSDHWLYWGTVTRRFDDETSVRFCVIEQTEFLSDNTSLPFSSKSISTSHSTNAAIGSGMISTTSCAPLSFKELHSSNRLHDYILRSTTMKICSPGKLRYYCTDQLGHEESYKREYFPHITPLEVHGFIVIYDVSRRASCHDASNLQQQQLAFLIDVLNRISKRKKPVVVVASKRDIVDEQCLSSVTQFLQKSTDFRKIPFVEASAHKNINVELTFLALARLIENSCNSSKSRLAKLKLTSYQEATREQDEHRRRSREAFVNRVYLSPAGFLTDWRTFLSRYSHQRDVARFIDLCGSEVARQTFEQFTTQWKTEIKRQHMAKLPEALAKILLCVGPVTNQSPKELLQKLRVHSQFNLFFASETSDDSLFHNLSIRQSFHGDDFRIPFALALKEPPDNGDSPFVESMKLISCAEAWATDMSAFEESLLQWHASGDPFPTVLPGEPFDHNQLSRIQPGSALNQEDQLEVYQKFQDCLRLSTREEFLDLLLESLPLFIRAASACLNCQGNNFSAIDTLAFRQVPHIATSQPRTDIPDRPISLTSELNTISSRSVQLPPADVRLRATPAPFRDVKEQQLEMIKNHIASDNRYHAMNYLPSERQTCLTSHLDILLYRSQPETSPLSLLPSTIPRHHSCSFVDQQESSQLTFSLSHCSAFRTGRCMDLVFENLCFSSVWSTGKVQNNFSSHFSGALGHAEKRLCVAVCAICTDVAAASSGINLFRAAGFVPNDVASPSMLTSCVTQCLVSSWPLASALLPPVDTFAASTNRNSVISPILGTVQASFLSHHKLLSLIKNPRQSSNVFDGVILLLSTHEALYSTLYSSIPPCTCGKTTTATYCCKCCLQASDGSHTTPRSRSLISRATAVKALVEHFASLPHLIFLAATSQGDGTSVRIHHGNENQLNHTEPIPQAPMVGACLNNLPHENARILSINDQEDVKQASISNGAIRPAAQPQSKYVLDALSDFLSACWTRKLDSGDNGHEDKTNEPQKTAFMEADDGGQYFRSTNNKNRFYHTSFPGRLLSYHHRCCRRHYHRHCRDRAAVLRSPCYNDFTTSGLSSASLVTSLNHSLPTPTLIRASSMPSRRRHDCGCGLQTPSDASVKRSRPPCCREPGSSFETASSKLESSLASGLDDCDTLIEVTTAECPDRLNCRPCPMTCALNPPLGGCSSRPITFSSRSLPSALDKGSPSLETFSLKFSEGLLPLPPDGVDPATPLHVLSLSGRWRRRRQGEMSRMWWTKELNDDEAGEKTNECWETEIFDIVYDALQLGTVHLVPCRHIQRSPDYAPLNSQERTTFVSFFNEDPLGQKSFSSGFLSKIDFNHHYNSHNHQRQINSGSSVPQMGGGVSSFLTSGLRAVTNSFTRPRERRRSSSIPCEAKAPPPFVSTTAATTTSSSSTPASSTLGPTHTTDHPTDATWKAHASPFVSNDADKESKEGVEGLNENKGFLLLLPEVSYLTHLIQLASVSLDYNGGAEQKMGAGKNEKGLQRRHWHLPSCPHRLCIPRQNIPLQPPPSSFSLSDPWPHQASRKAIPHKNVSSSETIG